MPRKIAAGCVVRATFDGEVRYLLVHPSGRYNRRRPYSIPKGLVDTLESIETTEVGTSWIGVFTPGELQGPLATAPS